MLTGVKLPVGSLEETVAIQRFEQNQRLEFLKVLAVNSAIMRAADAISASIGGGSAPSMDKHNELIDMIKDEFMPWISTAKNDKAEEVKKIMQEQLDLGPLKVTSMEYNKKGTKPGLY